MVVAYDNHYPGVLLDAVNKVPETLPDGDANGPPAKYESEVLRLGPRC